MTRGEQRFVLKTRTGLFLLPQPQIVAICVVFLYVGIGLTVAGVRLLAERNPGGLIPLAFGAGALAAAIAQLRAVWPVRVDARARAVRVRGHAPIPFGRVRRVEVDGADVCTVALVLDDDARVPLEEGWRDWKARHLAAHVAAMIGVPAVATTGEPLDSIDVRARWRPSVPGDRSAYTIVRAVGAVLAVVGVAAFLAGIVVSLEWASRLEHYELPLGDPEGIAVDSAGRIYVGSRAYRRLHRYNADGAFDRAWHAEVGKGRWQLAIDRDDRLMLRIGDGGDAPRWTIGADEQLVAATSPAGNDLEWQSRATRGPRGTVYTLHPLPVRVTLTQASKPAQTIVDQGWWVLAVTSPFPAWIVAVLGLLLIFFADPDRSLPSRRVAG